VIVLLALPWWLFCQFLKHVCGQEIAVKAFKRIKSRLALPNAREDM
jgi:hypothetical protein